MKAGASLLAVAFLCAGCLYEPDVEGCGPGMHYRRDSGCVHSPEAGFSIQMVGTGPYSAMVPYLRLSCLDGDDWVAHLLLQDVQNMTVTVREVDGDEVLWLQGHDASRFHATVPLKGRNGCSVEQEERWSVRQDPMDGALVVQVEGEASLIVSLMVALGSCKEPKFSEIDLQPVRVQEFKGEGNGSVALGKTFDRVSCR
jgi:hypothetical protein